MIKLHCRLLYFSTWNRLRQYCPTQGLTFAARTLEAEWAIYRRHQDGTRQLATIKECRQLKLNLGCGPNIKSGWINIDLAGPSDFILDLREPIPLADCTCQMIYSEHFFEHIGYPETALKLLRDYYRLLEPGGLLSIGVPDGELALKAYAGDDPEQFFTISKERWHPQWANTRMEQINFMFRQDGEHQFIYDWETLQKAMGEAGFSAIHRRAFNPELDSPERAWGTIYVNAKRP